LDRTREEAEEGEESREVERRLAARFYSVYLFTPSLQSTQRCGREES